MKKATCILLLALLLLIPFAGSCEDMGVQANQAFQFLQETSGLLQPLDQHTLAIRSVYLIQLPEKQETMNPEIIKAYGGFDHVLLLEIGYEAIPPITQSVYECVGVQADGSFTACPTPFDLIGRTFDTDAFDGVSITSVETKQ